MEFIPSFCTFSPSHMKCCRVWIPYIAAFLLNQLSHARSKFASYKLHGAMA